MTARAGAACVRRRTPTRGARRLLALLLVVAVSGLVPPLARGADPELPYGINTHLPSSTVLDLVRDAGISWIRVDFNWFMMEPARGVYDWSATDAVVSDARARGLNVFATLAYVPDWAAGGDGSNVPADWYQFVFDTVSRYKDSVKHWGMWNEPNLDPFFRGAPRQYIRDVLRPGARAVRDADGSALVLGPELAQLQSGHWNAWLATVLTQAGDAIDVVTHHDYSDDGLAVLRGLGGEFPFWRLRTPRGIMELTGTSGKPLWLTETGWRTDQVTQSEQADYYVQVLEGVNSAPWLDKVFFYEVADDPRFLEQWGILESDLTPKEAYYRYRDYITAHAVLSTPRPLRGAAGRGPVGGPE
jgi:polysaccharide biosynthesis protein PslG